MPDEYISREDLKEAFEEDGHLSAYVEEMIDSVPAAVVVEVVRCADCRYAYDTVCGWCCSHGICVDCTVREDFFCADGERKDGGQHE